jgi:dimethylhistidine N-methyltransferase
VTFHPSFKPLKRAGDSDFRLIDEVLRGLARRPKHLSPAYLYDERGSCLFDLICDLPEYYLTRTETAILTERAAEIASLIGKRALLLELGSGASTKTRLLLSAMQELAAYVPVDISRSHLLAAARELRAGYPGLEVLPVCADFTQPFALPRPRLRFERVVVFFPGSTLGNFDPPEATALLTLMRNTAGPDGGLVIGFDLVKDRERLTRAYNDSAGVTAAFNLNVLARLNRELGASFDLTAFRHEAIWNEAHSRIEMHLVSEHEQWVLVAGVPIGFAAGERLVTEHCHKYTLESFDAQARAAGWRAVRGWSDPERSFQVEYLDGCQDV